MVRAMLGGAEVPIGLVFGLQVAVKKHGVRSAFTWRTCDEGVLAADDKTRIVGERAIWRRHRAVILLQTPFHLCEELVLKGARIGELLLAESVLGLKITADLSIERCRVAHHLLPVVRPEPRIVIVQCHAVTLNGMGSTCSGGRLEGRTSIGLTVHYLLRERTIRRPGRSAKRAVP